MFSRLRPPPTPTSKRCPAEGDPVVDRPRADAEQVSDLLCRVVLVQPQQRRQTLVDACVLRLAAELFDLLTQQGVERETGCGLLHRRFSSHGWIARGAT